MNLHRTIAPAVVLAPPARDRIAPPAPTRVPFALSARRACYAEVRFAFERAAAAILLVVTSPLLLASMLAVKLTSPGPAIYWQTRLGRHGRPFRIFKVRTMIDNCESLTGPRWSIPGDARVTPIGRYLRMFHLDELPQLMNVLRGEMGLIGPRPGRPEIVADLKRVIKHFDDRLAMRPGITGFAQVQHAPDTDLYSAWRKLELDLAYLRRMGPWLDLKVLFCTALKLFGSSYPLARRLLGPIELPKYHFGPRLLKLPRPARPARRAA